jgi:hypothetical protein
MIHHLFDAGAIFHLLLAARAHSTHDGSLAGEEEEAFIQSDVA